MKLFKEMASGEPKLYEQYIEVYGNENHLTSLNLRVKDIALIVKNYGTLKKFLREKIHEERMNELKKSLIEVE